MQILLNRRKLIAGSGGKYIKFKDPVVGAICIANWSSDGVGLTMDDAAAVTSLGEVFRGNTTIKSFKELRFFTGLTSIYGKGYGHGAFLNCTNLEEVTLPDGVTILGQQAFQGTKIGTINLDNVLTVEMQAFGNCTLLNCILPRTIQTIEDSAFISCNSLSQELNLPNLTSLARKAFQGCLITKIVSLGTITSIPASGYAVGAFYGITTLTEAVLPATLIAIGDMTFAGCTSLATLTVHATSAPSLGSNVFQNCPLAHIYVPAGSVNDYKSASGWSSYASIIEKIPSN